MQAEVGKREIQRRNKAYSVHGWRYLVGQYPSGFCARNIFMHLFFFSVSTVCNK